MIAIYEPIYLLGQTLSDPAFKPLGLEANYPERREFRIIVDMYRRGMHRLQRFTGLRSPKFAAKTGISDKRFIDCIGENADADFCFINLFAYLSYISLNVWTQGEVYHPGLKKRAQDLLDSSDIDLEIENAARHGPRSERFWDDYVGGILLPIAEFPETYPQSAVGRAVLDKKRRLTSLRFFPTLSNGFSAVIFLIADQPSSAAAIRWMLSSAVLPDLSEGWWRTYGTRSTRQTWWPIFPTS